MQTITYTLRKNELKETLEGYTLFGTVYYPIKANANRHLLSVLNDYMQGTPNGFFISNLGQFHTLKDLGVDVSKIGVLNILMDSHDIAYLYQEGVRLFTFDNLSEVEKFKTYANLSEVCATVRLSTMCIYNDIVTPYGCDLTECNQILTALQGCKELGLSIYLNSEVKKEPNALARILDYIVKSVENEPYKLDFISLGGLPRYKALCHTLFNEVKKSLNLNSFILEPGRHLVEKCIDMETSINRVKWVNHKPTLFLAMGIYSGALDHYLYERRFGFSVKLPNGSYYALSTEEFSGSTPVTIYGCSADTKDHLGVYYIKPERLNDLLLAKSLTIKGMGSYSEVFTMSYGADVKTYWHIIE